MVLGGLVCGVAVFGGHPDVNPPSSCLLSVALNASSKANSPRSGDPNPQVVEISKGSMGRVDALDYERPLAVIAYPITEDPRLPVIATILKFLAQSMRNENLGREPLEVEQAGNFNFRSLGV